MVKIFSKIIFFLLLFLSPFLAYAAALSISPSTGTFEVGNRIAVRIVATSSVPFNAVSGVISFPSSIFSVESVSKAGSILNFWVTEPAIIQSSDTIKFEGVTLGGFFGSSGTVVTVNLRAVNVGSGQFSFQSGQILANDGEGTDITGNLIGATYSVKEAVIRIPTPEPAPQIIPEVVQPKPTLLAPEIALGTKYGAQAILGTSDYGGAQALITFTAENGVKVFILGVADDNGDFTLLVPSSLKRGTYTVSAVMIKEDKANSENSNVILVPVGSILSDVSWEISLLILLLILFIIYLILRIHLHLEQHIDKNIKREVHDAENILRKSFDIISEDVLDYDNKKLTSAEHKQMSNIKKDISEAEKIIDAKIRDIGSQ